MLTQLVGKSNLTDVVFKSQKDEDKEYGVAHPLVFSL
jgi:hypothetical protein